ncbi:hypothetical protein BVX99_01870 [bacterium F16]|nr:hypothetical protein BVX99_01870 [bacterium F16]
MNHNDPDTLIIDVMSHPKGAYVKSARFFGDGGDDGGGGGGTMGAPSAGSVLPVLMLLASARAVRFRSRQR